MKNMLENVLKMKKDGEIYFDKDSSEKFMGYEGKVKNVITKLNSAIDESNHFDLFLYTNRLLVGIMDYALTNGDFYDLKKSAEELGVEIFNGDYRNAKKILENMNFSNDILNAKVVENEDKISWSAFNPEFVDRLIGKIQDDEFEVDYFVFDGHGAYRPGFMLASYFNSGVCAIRNSKDSGRDKICKFLDGEKENLGSRLNNKNVVVLGEDVSTGKALFSLKNEIQEISDPAKMVTASSIALSDYIAEKVNYVGKVKSSF